jgi:hypothetical protein
VKKPHKPSQPKKKAAPKPEVRDFKEIHEEAAALYQLQVSLLSRPRNTLKTTRFPNKTSPGSKRSCKQEPSKIKSPPYVSISETTPSFPFKPWKT